MCGMRRMPAHGERGVGGMEIRKLDPKEHEKTRALYEEVFPEDSRGFVDYYYTEKTRDNQIYVAEEDDGIQAMLHLNPYVLMVNGTPRLAHYIVAVATRREYRRRGYMAALMERALQDMYQAGETFTYLMPAAEGIYLPHGFRTVYEQQERKMYESAGSLPGGMGEAALDAAAMALSENAKGTPGGEEIRAADEGDCEMLARAAENYLSAHYDIYARRDGAYYRRLLKECESEGGKLLLRVEQGNGRITGGGLYYKEDAEKEGSAGERPKIMARIVDVKKMLLCMRLKSLMAACFTVTDPVIRENNRCVVVTGTEFSGVMLMDGEAGNSEGVITIAALGSLLFGAKSVEEICGEDGVEMTKRLQGELGKLIPLQRIYLNEQV